MVKLYCLAIASSVNVLVNYSTLKHLLSASKSLVRGMLGSVVLGGSTNFPLCMEVVRLPFRIYIKACLEITGQRPN